MCFKTWSKDDLCMAMKAFNDRLRPVHRASSLYLSLRIKAVISPIINIISASSSNSIVFVIIIIITRILGRLVKGRLLNGRLIKRTIRQSPLQRRNIRETLWNILNFPLFGSLDPPNVFINRQRCIMFVRPTCSLRKNYEIYNSKKQANNEVIKAGYKPWDEHIRENFKRT